jgi:hypothetical protein
MCLRVGRCGILLADAAARRVASRMPGGGGAVRIAPLPLPLPLPRWPSAAAAAPQLVPLAPWGTFSLACTRFLTFWRWIRAQWWKKGITVHRIHHDARIHHDLQPAGNTRVHPVIRAHTGTTRGRDKTTAEASRVRQHPHAQAATGEGPSGVMPRVPCQVRRTGENAQTGHLELVCALQARHAANSGYFGTLRNRLDGTSMRQGCPQTMLERKQREPRGAWGSRC